MCCFLETQQDFSALVGLKLFLGRFKHGFVFICAINASDCKDYYLAGLKNEFRPTNIWSEQ